MKFQLRRASGNSQRLISYLTGQQAARRNSESFIASFISLTSFSADFLFTFIFPTTRFCKTDYSQKAQLFGILEIQRISESQRNEVSLKISEKLRFSQDMIRTQTT